MLTDFSRPTLSCTSDFEIIYDCLRIVTDVSKVHRLSAFSKEKQSIEYLKRETSERRCEINYLQLTEKKLCGRLMDSVRNFRERLRQKKKEYRLRA